MRQGKLARKWAGVTAAVAAAVWATSAQAVVYFEESFAAPFFDELGNPPAGWVMQNNSNPLGLTNWFQGNPAVFSSFNGDPNGYLATNFNNGSSLATISNWLVTPVISAPAGARVSFVTRSINSIYPDRLQLRASPTGGADVGSTETSVGDFTDLLVDINPSLSVGGYPGTWTRYEVSLPTAFNGRFAFRYFVTNAGPAGANSDFIGIDAFHVSDPSDPLPEPNPPPPPPTAANTVVGGSLTDTLDLIGQIKWYTFNHSGGPFSVDTNGSTLLGGNDTELGLYDASGNLVASDDDSGDGFLSLISLPDLAAGQYYLAVGGWNMIFGPSDWNVTANGASGDTGTFVINGLSFAPNVVLGDFDFNGFLDAGDIDVFTAALLESAPFAAYIAEFAAAYAAQYGGTLTEEIVVAFGDFDGNGVFDAEDVDLFIEAVLGSSSRPGLDGARAGRGPNVAAIPEPAALGLLAPLGLLMGRRRR